MAFLPYSSTSWEHQYVSINIPVNIFMETDTKSELWNLVSASWTAFVELYLCFITYKFHVRKFEDKTHQPTPGNPPKQPICPLSPTMFNRGC